jgi:probable HAF family extracellular repeat protein
MKNRNLMLCVCVLFLAIASVPLSGQEPAAGVSHFKNVNAPGAIQTDPYAIDKGGDIAGDYVDSSGVQHGMVLKGKTLTTIDRAGCVTTPGATAIAFYGINTAGTLVGWCQDIKTGLDDAFSYSKGKFVTISFPKSMGTQARGINDKGQIVGAYLDSAGNQHGFLLSSGKYTSLNVTGGDTNTDAWGINNAGLITLLAINGSGNYDSFLLNGKKYTMIDVPGETQSEVAAIDSSGDRIYTVIDSSGNSHGAFYLNSQFRPATGEASGIQQSVRNIVVQSSRLTAAEQALSTFRTVGIVPDVARSVSAGPSSSSCSGGKKDEIYSNLGPAKDAFDYTTGYYISGPSSPLGEQQWIGMPFTPTKNDVATEIDAAAFYFANDGNAGNDFNFGIWSDSSGVPGTELNGVDMTNLPTFTGTSGDCCNTQHATIPATALTAGTQYWVVLSTDGSGTNSLGVWDNVYNDAVGTQAYNQGSGWNTEQAPLSAFAVCSGSSTGNYIVFDDPSGVGTTEAFGLNDNLKIVGRYAPTQSKRPPTNPSQGYSAIGCCKPRNK